MNRQSPTLTLTITALALALGSAAACSSNSDQHAPTLPGTGTGGTGGQAPTGKSGGSGAGDAGSAGEAGDGGTAGGPGAPGGAAGQAGEGGALEQGMIVPVTPGACSETAVWASAVPLEGISTDANEQLLALTVDELDIVFLRDGNAMLAHRDLASAAFGAAIALTVPDGYGVGAGVALSADGKTMVLLATGEQSFAAFSRTSRSDSFATTPDDTAFVGINQRALQTMQHYAAPVLAPDGKSFVFAAFTPEPTAGFPSGFEGVSLVYEAVWTSNGWAMPESISQDLFDGTSAARALPSALSSDSRTLFYFEEGSSRQMARFRDRPDAPLYSVLDLDQRARAAPDIKCDRLYFSSEGDVLVASQ